MKTYILPLLLAMPSITYAQESKTGGLQFDVGIPDGVGIGGVVRPEVDWLQLGLSGTFNGGSGGMRLGATLDPIKHWIAPTITIEGGWVAPGRVITVSNSPTIGYDYLNLHVGLNFGNRDHFVFFVHAGPSFMNVRASNVRQSLTQDGSISISDFSATATAFPTVKVGLTVFIW